MTKQEVLNSKCGSLNLHLKETPVKKKKKYRNSETEINGIRFDSKKEAARYKDLLIRLKIGEIGLLERQKRFTLIKSNEKERKCDYVADFAYWEGNMFVVEDVKSEMTRKLPVYIMKRKLMKSVHNIEIKEV